MKETVKMLLAQWRQVDRSLKNATWVCLGIGALCASSYAVEAVKSYTRPVSIFETLAARDCLDVYRVTQYESTATMEDAEARRWVARCLTAGGIKR